MKAGKTGSKTKMRAARPKASRARPITRNREFLDLRKQALQAMQVFDYPTAVSAYSRALDMGRDAKGGLDPETEFQLLSGRATCFEFLGVVQSEIADLEVMAAIASSMDDLTKQVEVVNRAIEPWGQLGKSAQLIRTAHALEATVRARGNKQQIAGILLALGRAYSNDENLAKARPYLEEALEGFESLGDRQGQAACLRELGSVNGYEGRPEEARQMTSKALALQRAIGDRKAEARSLSLLSIFSADQAAKRDYGEAALSISVALNDVVNQSREYNNLGLVYAHLGLYDTARRLLEQAVRNAKERGLQQHAATYLESLARLLLHLGSLEQAAQYFRDGIRLAGTVKSRFLRAYNELGLGQVLLAQGHPRSALKQFKAADRNFEALNTPVETSTARALAGLAHARMGHFRAAEHSTRQAVSLLESAGDSSGDYPPQLVWWLHYQVLRDDEATSQSKGSKKTTKKTGNLHAGQGEAGWEALQRALTLTLDGVAKLSDRGLRRNYLSKVALNREILTEWAKQARRHGLTPEVETHVDGDIQVQLKRMLGIGLKLNERRDPRELAEFILEQFVELSGAERSALFLNEDSGTQWLASSRGFMADRLGGLPDKLASVTDSVSKAHNAVLRPAVSAKDLTSEPKRRNEAVSLVCLPLMAHGHLRGLLYGDIHTLYGAFGEADIDLLSAFANQAAAAIENARLYQGLETRVQERTAELHDANTSLEHRAAELTIVNSVGQALAEQLDFQSIINLVGDRVREIFGADTTYIAIYDRASDWVGFPYYIERGVDQRQAALGFPLGQGLTSAILKTRRPLRLGSIEEQFKHQGVAVLMPGEQEDKNQSYLAVPIFSGDKASGVISVQKYETNAFSEGDERLLSTLASSMSVALENARLFDETNRLLEETRQRNAELAVINSVGEALAEQLEIQAIYDVVGDKLHDVFPGAQVVDILSYHPAEDTFIPRYVLEKGKRYQVKPWKARGFRKHIVETGQPIVINRDIAEAAKQYDNEFVIVGEAAKCWVGVPLKVGEAVIGVLSLQHIDREGAFSDSDVALLQTLARSMSVALENARLFDETTGLLEETKERNAELAVINRVQEGLASQLDFQAIIDLVGDEIYSMFPDESIGIALFEGHPLMMYFRYWLIDGEQRRDDIPPQSPIGFSAKVIDTGKTVVHNQDVENAAKELGSVLLVDDVNWPKSVIFLPLRLQGKVRGVISLQNLKTEDAFDPPKVRLLESLAGSLSVALENARLFDETGRLLEETRQRNAELAVINSIQEGLASKLDFEAIIELVGEKIQDVFGAQGLGIRIYDPETQLVHYPYETERGERLPPFEPRKAMGFSGHIIKTRKPLMVNRDIQAWMEKLGGAPLQGTLEDKSFLGVPVIVDDVVRGLITLENVDHEDAFTESDQRLLMTIASSMGVALDNARLFDETGRLLEETRQRNAELAVINSVQAGLASKLDLNGVVEVVGDRISEILGTGDMTIRLLSEDGQTLMTPYLLEHGQRFPVEALPLDQLPIPARAIRSGKPVLANREESLAATSHGATSIGDPDSPMPASNLFLPFFSGDKVVGLISVHDKTRPDAFGDREIELLATLANSMSVALENARLFDQTNRLLEETRRRNAELAVINSVQAGLASKLDLVGIVEVVGDEIAKIFSGHDVGISLLSDDGQSFITPYYLEHGDRFPVDPFPMDDKNYTTKTLKSRAPLVLNREQMDANRSKDSRVVGDLDSPFPLAELRLPILSGDRPLGVITLGNRERRDAYGESEISLLTTLANSMSVALENARLFDQTNRLLEETRQRNAELAVINSVQAGLASKLDLAGVVEVVGDEIAKILKSGDISIRLVNENGDHVIIPYFLEHNQRFPVDPMPLDEGSFTQRALASRLPLVVSESELQAYASQGGAVIGDPDSPLPKTMLYVPILSGERALGVIAVADSFRENAFGKAEISLVTTLANSMSVALENARLFDQTNRLLEETRQRNAELAVINSIQDGLASQLDMQAIFDLVGNKIQEIFDAQVVDILTYNSVTDLCHYHYMFEQGQHFQVPDFTPTGFSGRILKTRAPLVINSELNARAKEYGSKVHAGQAPKAYMGVPLMRGEEAFGVIDLQNIDHEGAFSESDLRLLNTLASSMSVALENARLFDETNRLLEESRQHNLELAAISTVSQALVAENDLDKLIELVGEQVVETFKADIAYVALWDARTNMITFPYLQGEDDATPMPFGTGVASQILRSGEPLLLNRDIDNRLTELDATLEGTEVASYLGVPISVAGQAIGVISVQSTRQEDRFDDGDVRLLSTIAANTGAAISSARLYEETKQRASELATINVIGQGLLAQMDLERVVDLVGDSVKDIFEADSMNIGLYDRERQVIRLLYNLHLGERLGYNELQLGEGLSSIVVKTGQPLLLNTWEEIVANGTSMHPDRPDFAPEEDSWLGVPILSGSEISGLIFANRYRNYAFDESDLRLLSTIAANMGVAIRNAQLYSETQRRAEEMAALNEIGKETSATLDLPTVLDRITRNARQVLAADTAAAVLLGDDGKSLRPTAAVGNLAEEVRAFTWTLGEGLIGSIVQSGQAERINDVVADARTIELPGTEKSDSGEKLIVAPLISRERPVGAIAAWRSKNAPAYSQEDLDFIVGLSQQAVIAIQNAQLFDEAQKRAGQMEALNELGREISATLDLETVLSRITAQSRELLHGDTSAVFMLEDDDKTLRVIAADGLIADQVRAMTAEMGHGMVGSIAKSGVAEVINDVASDPRGVHIPGTSTDNENKKLMAAPLLTKDRVLGVMAVWRGTDKPLFTQADLVFLASLARQATIAIENARLFDETQRQRDYSRALVDNSPVAIVTTDLSGDVVSWNPAAERLFAYGADEAIGRNIDSLITTDEIRKEAVNYTHQVWVEGRVNAVTRRARKDGSLVEVELLALPVSVSGVHTGLIAIYHDITELKRAERAMAEQKEYLEAVLSNTPVAIVTTDNHADVVSWNPAAEKLFGYTAEEAAGEDIDELIARRSDEMHAQAENYNQQASHGRLHELTQRNRKDGSLVDVELLGVPVNMAGEQTGIIAIYHDITELKSAERELERQKEYLEAVLKNSPAAIVTVDREFRVVSWNPAAEKLFGYTEEEAIGQDAHDLHSKSEAILAESLSLSEKIAGGQHVQAITKRTRKDGELVDVEVQGLPVVVEGHQVGNVIIYHDLTELLKAQREAEAANEAKSAFLATMSHEIRTPMNAVIGMSGLLLDTPLNEEQHEFAEIIRNSGDALLGIINDVLDFSKIEAGKMDLEHQPFDLRECVEGTLDLVATRASEKGLDLAYVMDEGVPAGIVGDLTRLRQILLNLLTNAVKFTEQGEVVLTIAAQDAPAANGDGSDGRAPREASLHFTVRDTGIGIPLERMDRLFQSFSQVDASTARKYGGTGLGLAISKRLSELMGGTMWAESKANVGTTFHFTIRTEQVALPAPSDRRLSRPDPQLRGRPVLIVDDNDTNRRILTLQVKGWGMTPQDTASPSTALEWIKQSQPFDVAILDMHMPEMDGLTLAGEIRQLPERAKLPMILFTSLGRRETGAEELGFAALLTKPIKPSQLFDALMGIFSSEPIDVKAPRSQPPRLDPGMAKRHPLRILLAEDNAVNQKLALRLLAQMGYRADVAANGLEAIESLERQTYDLVLMDVQMPEMDGLEASRQINARWSRAQRPQIVAMTANAMQGDRELCMAAGMDDYITKPIRVEELVGALDRVPVERSGKPNA